MPHQDSSFLATEPPTATGLWLALEPATVDNGCLWTLPALPADRVARRFMRRRAGSMARLTQSYLSAVYGYAISAGPWVASGARQRSPRQARI